MKKGSLIRQLAIMLTAQILLLIVVLLLVIAYTIHNARVEKEKMLSNLLTVYGKNLENRIQRADGILENITLNQSTELDLITSDKESERYYARVELFESMRLDGASEFRIFTTLVTPLLLPMISLMAIHLVLFSWNDFVWPLVTLTEDSKRTITVGLYWLSKSQVGRDYGVLMSGYLLSALPLVVVFMFGMKAFMKGLTAGAIKI